MVSNAVLVVLSTAIMTSLYSYGTIRQGRTRKHRLLLAVPVIVLFLLLPVLVYDYRTAAISSALLGCIFSWLASFKLLMLVFDRGPLTDPAVATSILHFSALLCSPINLKAARKKEAEHIEKEHSWNFLGQSVLKVGILLITVQIVDQKGRLQPQVYHLFCYLNLYLFASLIMDLFAAVTSFALGIELLADFDRPFLSQSLSEFWARRWNLTVSGVLRGSVYEPVLEFLAASNTHAMEHKDRASKEGSPQRQGANDGKAAQGIVYSPEWTATQLRTFLKWRAIALLASFTVSGLMHELAFWYLSHTVTGEMTLFFMLHGVAVIVESWIRRSYILEIPKVIKIILTLAFCFVTAELLFLPPLIRVGVDNRVILELKEGLFLA